MKLNTISTSKEDKGSLEMPKQFCEEYRQEIIKRAFESERSEERQPYGSSPTAGKRHSTYLSKRRHNYKATYGIGQSRTPRKITSRSGSRMNYVGAFAPQTVGGRRAHPPKAEKIQLKKINKKERNFAIRSAISATMDKEAVLKRGHKIPDNYPFIIDDIEKTSKAKEIKEILSKLGFDQDLERTRKKTVRAGKGKGRGRKYKKKVGILLVAGSNCDLLKSVKSIPGVEAAIVDDLKVSQLAPGGDAGRATIWTRKAVEKISKENMFM